MQDMPTITKRRKVNYGLNRSLCKGHCVEYKTGLFRSVDGVRRTYEYEIVYCSTCEAYIDRNKRWREKRQNRVTVIT